MFHMYLPTIVYVDPCEMLFHMKHMHFKNNQTKEKKNP